MIMKDANLEPRAIGAENQQAARSLKVDDMEGIEEQEPSNQSRSTSKVATRLVRLRFAGSHDIDPLPGAAISPPNRFTSFRHLASLLIISGALLRKREPSSSSTENGKGAGASRDDDASKTASSSAFDHVKLPSALFPAMAEVGGGGSSSSSSSSKEHEHKPTAVSRMNAELPSSGPPPLSSDVLSSLTREERNRIAAMAAYARCVMSNTEDGMIALTGRVAELKREGAKSFLLSLVNPDSPFLACSKFIPDTSLYKILDHKDLAYHYRKLQQEELNSNFAERAKVMVTSQHENNYGLRSILICCVTRLRMLVILLLVFSWDRDT
ncbi:unnamed protein product [Amoebophrya sp. A25]|nr:unnamed protein product [Amoebophrya sp. A25]|eukprot:GSA25T00021551001.1